MARSEARILVDIWDDPDFVALDPVQQRMFFFLLSQRDLAHTGVLALRERRWARFAAGLTATTVFDALTALDAGRFIVVDEDTEEVLVRAYIRRDKVYKQPNVLQAAKDHLPLIASKKIKMVLWQELLRISDSGDDMSERSRELLKEMIVALEAEVCEPSLNPSGIPAGNPSENPSRNPSGNPSANPSGNPSSGALGERGVVTAVSSDSPSPSPLSPSPSATAAPSPPGPGPDGKPKRDEPGSRADVDDVCKYLADQLEEHGYKRPSISKRWRQEARLLLDEKRPYDIDVAVVKKGIDWAMGDDFWRPVIQSTANLRKHFDKMRDKAIQEARRGNAGQRPTAAWNPPTDSTNYFED